MTLRKSSTYQNDELGYACVQLGVAHQQVGVSKNQEKRYKGFQFLRTREPFFCSNKENLRKPSLFTGPTRTLRRNYRSL